MRGLPARLHRGQKLVKPGGLLPNVRLKRYSQGDERLAGDWPWRSNPFSGSEELDGLRIMMSLINNWDLTDENNAIHERLRDGQVVARHYLVGDLGSSFGSAKLTWPMHRARGNLNVYSRRARRSMEIDIIASLAEIISVGTLDRSTHTAPTRQVDRRAACAAVAGSASCCISRCRIRYCGGGRLHRGGRTSHSRADAVVTAGRRRRLSAWTVERGGDRTKRLLFQRTRAASSGQPHRTPVGEPALARGAAATIR